MKFFLIVSLLILSPSSISPASSGAERTTYLKIKKKKCTGEMFFNYLSSGESAKLYSCYQFLFCSSYTNIQYGKLMAEMLNIDAKAGLE